MKYPYKIQKTITGKYELVREFDDELENIIKGSLPSRYQVNYTPAIIPGEEQIDLPAVSMRELQAIFYDSWVNTAKDGTSKPVLVFGGSGIGKSDSVAKFAQSIATGIPVEGTEKNKEGLPQQHREFIDISKLESDDEEKFEQVLANVGNYFLYYLITGSDITPDILRGIYKTSDSKTKKGVGVLSGQVPKYLKLMMQKEAVGCLFLDEVNQAAENQKLLFQLLLGHKVSQYQISKRIRMYAAGNIGAYYKMANVISNLAASAIGRTAPVYLKVSPKDWVEYIRKEKFEDRYGIIHSYPEVIISFLFSTNEDFETVSKLFYQEPGEADTQSSQRGWPNPRNITGFGIELINIVSELKNKNKPLKKDLPSSSILTFKHIETDLLKKVELAGAKLCGIEWGQRFAKFFFYAYFQDIDQVIASDFTKKGKEKDEALDPEEYWAKSYVITTYFNKLSNTYKGMDEKTIYEHFQKLAYALFKYIPHGTIANIKEYLKKVTGDMNTKDDMLFHRFAGYVAKFKARNEEEKVVVNRFKKEIQALMISPDEEKSITI